MSWNYCSECKFFEQGEKSSFCGNPKQPNEDYKKYVYYNFNCGFAELGVAQSRVDYMEKLTSKPKNK